MLGCRPLTDDEISQAMQHLHGSKAKERDRCMLVLGLRTGFRISELLSLRVWDVVQYGKVLPQVRVYRRFMKGKKKTRIVPLNIEARKALARWLPILYRWRGNLPDTYLFQSFKGGAITRQHASRIMRTLAAQFHWPPPVSTHSLRKTFAFKVYAQACKGWKPHKENPLRVVQVALGHASMNTTVLYLGLDEAEVTRCVLSVDYGGAA